MAGILAENGTAIDLENGTALLLEGSGGPASGAAAFSAGTALRASASVTTFGSSMHASAVLTASGFSGKPGARFSASPVLLPRALVIAPAAAAFSASPSLTASGFVPLLLARPSLSASAKVTHPGAASLHGAASLSAAVSASAAHLAASPSLLAPGKMAAARLFAGTSLSASGRYFMPGQAAMYAGAQLAAAARATAGGSAHLAASTSLASAALNRAVGSAALSAPAYLAAAAFSSAAHLAASPALTAAGQHSAVAAAHLAASASAAVSGRVTERASAAFHGVPALSSGAVLSRTGSSRLSAAAALSAAGAVHKDEAGAAALRAAAVLRAAGLRTTFGAASLASAASLTARGLRTAVAQAALAAQVRVLAAGQVLPGARLSASASLSGVPVVGRAGKALLSGGAKLSGTAHGITFPKAAFRAPGVLVPAPDGIVKASGSFACSPSLAASAATGPRLPFPVRPKGSQPSWQRDVQRFAVVQERQRHAQALWQYGELAVFALMWRPEDIGTGLARRCTRCYTPQSVISDIAPESPLPPGWPTAAAESQISAAYGQGSQFRCPLCYGTQVIAAGDVRVPGVRALLVRPAILTDTDQNQQRSAKGTVNTGQTAVQTTPDFRVNTLDYCFRADGRRYQLQVPARTTLRTGFGLPWQAAAGISYNLASASLESEKASVAYIVPPAPQDLARVLGTYTRIPADYAWFEQVNGPLVPEEEPPAAAYGFAQPSESLGV